MKSWMMKPKFALSRDFLSVHHEYFVGTFASILLVLETLDYTICIGSTPTFLYLLWLAQLDRKIKHTWTDFEHLEMVVF